MGAPSPPTHTGPHQALTHFFWTLQSYLTLAPALALTCGRPWEPSGTECWAPGWGFLSSWSWAGFPGIIELGNP